MLFKKNKNVPYNVAFPPN